MHKGSKAGTWLIRLKNNKGTKGSEQNEQKCVQQKKKDQRVKREVIHAKSY